MSRNLALSLKPGNTVWHWSSKTLVVPWKETQKNSCKFELVIFATFFHFFFQPIKLFLESKKYISCHGNLTNRLSAKQGCKKISSSTHEKKKNTREFRLGDFLRFFPLLTCKEEREGKNRMTTAASYIHTSRTYEFKKMGKESVWAVSSCD